MTTNTTNPGYLIAFDTICDGWQTGTGDDGQPVIYQTEDEAFKEMFTDALSGLENADDKPAPEVMQAAQDAENSGDIAAMRELWERFPDLNYYDEFIIAADQYQDGYKTIFTI